MNTDKHGFEVITCSRCGGTGEYSYNQLTGTRCFKCSGGRVVYSKRALAARRFWQEIRSRKVTEIKVGDVIWERGNDLPGCASPSRWVTVTEVRTDAEEKARHEAGEATCHGLHKNPDGETVRTFYYALTTGSSTRYHFPTDSVIVKASSPEEAKEKLARALEYQNSLTKTGKPRK